MTSPGTIATNHRKRLTITGVVQGVGFRPFVFKLAHEKRLRGFVLNEGGAVIIEIEGSAANVQSFEHDLSINAPPLSRIDKCEIVSLAPQGQEDGFRIFESSESSCFQRFISPDASTCDTCLAELFDRNDRRFRYPFINCTNCGPRFTIIEKFPYDRSRTTMSGFAMCDPCRDEYGDPASRRFHAQPNACWQCGPQLTFVRAGIQEAIREQALTAAVGALRKGEIVAVKGLGGFHLVCDATAADVVERLRHRKGRLEKPLAVMYPSLEDVMASYDMSPAAEHELKSHRRPIVLLQTKCSGEAISAAVPPVAPGTAPGVAPGVAPGLDRVGVVLPYTPLHYLLSADFGGPLVVTSGNTTDEPICIDNFEAQQRLGDICDAFLLHDRPISARYDDSVMVAFGSDTILPLRRSRGYAPEPIKVNYAGKTILAVGAHLKNTFCVLSENKAYVSQHIGDLDNLEALTHFEESLQRTLDLFQLSPELIACDMHPDYTSTNAARELSRRLSVELVSVQHHHAHIAACISEHGISEPVMGLALDGAGFGTDGTIWGGEFLLCTQGKFSRVAHLEQVEMPGGSAAIKQPWRMALSYLAGHEQEFRSLYDGLSDTVKRETLDGVVTLLQRTDLNLKTSSCGRLFDAVAVAIGLPVTVSYEGQSAMQLEATARRHRGVPKDRLFEIDYTCRKGQLAILPARQLVLEAMRQRMFGAAPELVAWQFHASLSRMLCDALSLLCSQHETATVCLSGGVFQNMLLLELMLGELQNSNLRVLFPRQLPCNDGGISLGQAVIAATRES